MKLLPYIILFSTIQITGEEIKGAFGYSFGAKYIVENPKPKIQFRNFKEIELIKDQSGRIYQIKSKTSFDTWQETENEYNTIQSLLKQKYPRKSFEIYYSESKTINNSTLEFDATFKISAREYKKRKLERETQIELNISNHRNVELIYTDLTRKNKETNTQLKENSSKGL